MDNKCNGCEISREHTFPFIAIGNVYSKYLFFKRLSCILFAIIMILTTAIIYLTFNVFSSNNHITEISHSNIVMSIEENSNIDNNETYFNRKPIKYRKRRTYGKTL